MNRFFFKSIFFTTCLIAPMLLTGQHTVLVSTPEGRDITLTGDSTKFGFKSTMARYEGDFEKAATYKIKAIEADEYKKTHSAYYDAACFMSLAGNESAAFEYLKKSLEMGFGDVAHVMYDKDLEPLHSSKQWKKVLAPFKKVYFKENNESLAIMYHEDQTARLSGPIDWDVLNVEDEKRRKAVLKALSKGKVKSAHDYYKAAMMMHHGKQVEDYEKAHELALIALEFDEPHNMAPWLAAASKDRYLLKAGKPQWFGTQGMQYIKEIGKMGMDPSKIDTTAVTPAQRQAWNAPDMKTIRLYINSYLEAEEKKKDN